MITRFRTASLPNESKGSTLSSAVYMSSGCSWKMTERQMDRAYGSCEVGYIS